MSFIRENNRKSKTLKQGSISPLSVSVLIPVFNEEKVIKEKLDNCLECADGFVLEILIIDDYSTDSTVDKIKSWTNSKDLLFSTKLLTNIYKKGKAGALRTGIEQAQADIILITDADNLLFHDTIREALKLFNDPTVWGVTSTQVDMKKIAGRKLQEGLPISFYERFRNIIRQFASHVDSVIEFHGQCMFFRREKIPIPDPTIRCDDHDLAIRIRLKGGKGKYCAKSRYIEFVQPKNSFAYKLYLRRAEAIVEVLFKHASCLFNPRLGIFGLFIYPVSFVCYLIFPLLAHLALCGIILFLVSCNLYVVIIFSIFLVIAMMIQRIRKLGIMQFIMLHAFVHYLFRLSKKRSSWVTPRSYKS